MSPGKSRLPAGNEAAADVVAAVHSNVCSTSADR
jgi:hypothetical protein